MGNNTFNNTFHKEASVAQGNNATANQYIYGKDSEELIKKLDKMFDELNQNQARELEQLTDELFKLLDEKISQANNLSSEQIKEFQEAKMSSDLKAKIKFGLPMNFVISQLTGMTFEIEKEWKRSKEIQPKSVISFLRKIVNGEELQITNLNEPKQLT